MDILVAEDSHTDNLIITKYIKGLGYNVHSVYDGVQGLESLTKNTEIRMVITDWMMPKMDGIELCKAIRSQNFERYIYIILLTSNTESKYVVEGINNGSDDYIKKPIIFEELSARLKSGVRVLDLEKSLELKNNELEKALSVIEKDLQYAEVTQAQLLPKFKTIRSVTFDWFFKPCSHIGGDMLGYFSLDSDHVAFYQLDVSGHGIPAAMFSFTLNKVISEFENQSSTTDGISDKNKIIQPSDILTNLNNRFQSNPEFMLYFTMVYGILNTVNGVLSISHAGHPSSLLFQKNMGIVALEGKGVPVGMMPDSIYETQTIQLDSGDKLFMCSDGLPEAKNKNNEFFGMDRLIEMLTKKNNESISSIIEIITKEMIIWNGNDNFDDDLTYLILEWNP